MYDNPFTNGTVHGLSRVLIRDINRAYYGKESEYIMDKAKVLKTGLKIGALALAGVVTLVNNKLSNDEMKETVAKKVEEALANQAKESN